MHCSVLSRGVRCAGQVGLLLRGGTVSLRGTAVSGFLSGIDAARVPVIWATQVLENETKKGLPSRAEITDAAESQHADCVMLNKGPHILAAIRTLDNILSRMQSLRRSKTA